MTAAITHLDMLFILGKPKIGFEKRKSIFYVPRSKSISKGVIEIVISKCYFKYHSYRILSNKTALPIEPPPAIFPSDRGHS